MTLSAIAAMANNRIIGIRGDLPWRIPEDFRFFKNKTAGHVVIMGRKTFESLPSVLPGRFHIVISRQINYVPKIKNQTVESSEILVVTTAEDAIAAAESIIENEPEWGDEVFNIGGGEIFAALLPETNKVYLTEVDLEVDPDSEGVAYFPKFHEEDFKEVERRAGAQSGTDSLPNYDFVTYERISQ